MKVSPVGWVLLVVMVGCLSLGFFASGRAAGFGVLFGALILLLVAGEGMSRSGAWSARRKKELFERDAERARSLHPKQ